MMLQLVGWMPSVPRIDRRAVELLVLTLGAAVLAVRIFRRGPHGRADGSAASSGACSTDLERAALAGLDEDLDGLDGRGDGHGGGC